MTNKTLYLITCVATAIVFLSALTGNLPVDKSASGALRAMPAVVKTHQDDKAANGLEFVGMSYNILTGNPLNSDTQDPGILKQVFEFSYEEDKKTPDDKWTIPDQVQADLRNFCQFQSDYSSYTGIQAYQKEIRKSINFELSVFSPFAFSIGKEYVKNNLEFSITRQVQWSIDGSCEAYSLSVDTYNLQKLRPDFIEGVRRSFESNDWSVFIQTYGTHFMNRCTVGGRMSLLQSMEARAYANLLAENFNFEIGAKASFVKITGRGTYDSDKDKVLGETFYRNSRHSTVYFLGAIPPEDSSLDDWKVAVRDEPTPIGYDLLPLYELVTPRDFPTLDKEQVKQSMLAGFNKFCTANNCTAPKQDPPFPAAAQAKITKTDLYGSSTGGSYVADAETTNPYMHVCRVRMQCGDDMDGLQLFLCDGRGNEINLVHIGGNGGKHPVDVFLPYSEDDYINGFTGTYYYSKKYPYLISFQFTTTSGRLVPEEPCGKHRGDQHFSGNTVGPLVGVYGYQDTRIERIGFYGSQFFYPDQGVPVPDSDTVAEALLAEP